MTKCSPVFTFSLRIMELLVIPGIKNLKSVCFACMLGSSLMVRAFSCYSVIWTLAPRRVNSFLFSKISSVLTYYSLFQVHHNSPGHVFSRACLSEECGERVIIAGLVDEGTIWLNAMLQTEEFPTCIANLNSGLANVNRDALTLEGEDKE